MALPDDLLAQARHLLKFDPRRPKQASLRRAVSAAYYGLFHLLTGDAARRLSPVTPSALELHVRRGFDHATIRQVCMSIADPRSKLNLTFQLRPSSDLLAVANTFQSLQDARHAADYDLVAALSRGAAALRVQSAEAAFVAWRRVRASDEANVFLVALLMKKDWPRR